MADERYLVCRVGEGLCAVPVAAVRETMRPHPVTPVADGPGYLLGVAIVRGALVPVVDAGLAVSATAGRPGRWVTLAGGPGDVALAVDEVVGVRTIDTSGFEAGAVAGFGVFADRMLAVLDTVRIVPQPLWDTVLERVRT